MFEQLNYPIIQAPMAGGVSTSALAIAVSQKGGLGFLAAGYKTPAAIEQEMVACRATNLPYGVNLFVPNLDAIDESVSLYKNQLEHDYQLSLSIGEDSDDFWQQKLELVLKYNVPYISFTFGCPSKDIISQLKENGSKIIISVTNLDEARLAEQNGADAVCLQGIEAGGHRATFTNSDEIPTQSLIALIQQISREINVPIIAAGGIMNGQDIYKAMFAGACAVQLGTAFLCTHESGANPVYKKALTTGVFTETALTRAFTGRYARGLKNEFIVKYEPYAPAVYPAVNKLTQPIRAQALKDQNPQQMSMWANTRFNEIRNGSVDEVIDALIREWEHAKQ